MAPAEIVIHAQYSPDGTIKEIGQRPQALTGQQWFNFLSRKIPHAAQALAGGRTIFRVQSDELEMLKAQATA